MDDPSELIRAVFAAVQAAVPNLTVTLNGKPARPESLDAYVIVWCGTPGQSPVSWNGRADAGTMRWQTQAIGYDADTVASAGGRIVKALTETRIPAPAGYRFSKARFTYGQIPYTDETVLGQPNVTQADLFAADVTAT